MGRGLATGDSERMGERLAVRKERANLPWFLVRKKLPASISGRTLHLAGLSETVAVWMKARQRRWSVTSGHASSAGRKHSIRETRPEVAFHRRSAPLRTQPGARLHFRLDRPDASSPSAKPSASSSAAARAIPGEARPLRFSSHDPQVPKSPSLRPAFLPRHAQHRPAPSAAKTTLPRGMRHETAASGQHSASVFRTR